VSLPPPLAPLLRAAVICSLAATPAAAQPDSGVARRSRETGRELWRYELPAGGQATPMTYRLDGRQYLVIAAGGHGKLGTKQGDYVLAFTLPLR